MDKSRRRSRKTTRPRWHDLGTDRDTGGTTSRSDAPRCPLRTASQASCLGAGGSDVTVLLRLLTPRYEADLFVWPPPASANRGQDGLMAEKALDSRQTPFDLPACPGYTPFEVHLASIVCHCTSDREPQHGDPGSRGVDHRSLEPSIELRHVLSLPRQAAE